jgi:AcrR family transcriptional regulator/DNA-binding MarR family transcriptional regulator
MTLTFKQRRATVRLRPGPGGPSRGQVTQIQRGRMLAAAVEVIEEVGYPRMTVAQVISRARVSRKTFYDVFTDRQDCFLAAFEHAVWRGRSIARAAYGAESGWRDGIRAALASVLVFMDDEPGLAKLCVVEALGAGGSVLERRAQLLDELARVIDRGRSRENATGESPDVTAEGVVGGIFAVLHTRIVEDGQQPLFELLGPLMSMIVLPYFGARAAAAELNRRPPDPPSRQTRPRTSVRSKDPLQGLNIRLTYRTVRVLMTIAGNPGASNREIAKGSGVVDQGQISKLLARLARLGLAENVGAGQERGAANAWHLTPRGAQVERATRPR